MLNFYITSYITKHKQTLYYEMIMALQKLYLKLLSLALLSNHTKNKETGYNLGTNDSFDYIMELQCII